MATDLTGAKLLLSPSDLPRHRSSINDNYCVVTGAVRDLNSVPVTGKDCHCVHQSLKTRTLSPVYCHVASHVPFAGGLPQKKGINPDHQSAIKSVKSVSCVNHLSSVKNVTNVPPVVPNLPVGARLRGHFIVNMYILYILILR